MNLIRSALCLYLLFLAPWVCALPVPLGEVDIGLESFDGYQEGRAFISTDESGSSLELLLTYRGFGLDTVTWTFVEEDLIAFRDATALSSWWRSRMLEMDVSQTVLHDISLTNPSLSYAYRSQTYLFESTPHLMRFIRQGRDYALLLTEESPGADSRRSGEKSLPVFTVHFLGPQLPELRDMLSEESMAAVLAEYARQKAAIEAILADGPEAAESSE